jgi:hypothetical protein
VAKLSGRVERIADALVCACRVGVPVQRRDERATAASEVLRWQLS